MHDTECESPACELSLSEGELDVILAELETLPKDQGIQLSDSDLEELQRDESRKIQQQHMNVWNEKREREKGKWNPTTGQIKIRDYRKGDGRDEYNEMQKVMRLARAEEEGRVIKTRTSLKNMTDGERMERRREQEKERQRKKRAAQTPEQTAERKRKDAESKAAARSAKKLTTPAAIA